METLFLVLHVVGAVFIIGPMAVLPQSGLRAIRSGDAGAVQGLAKSTRIFSIASVVVALLGFALVGMAPAKDHVSLGTPWVLGGLIAWLIAAVLSMTVVVPALRQAAVTLAEPDHAAAPGYRKVAIGSGLVSLLLLIVVVLMVWKP
jgi:uncharacterized membrane protein